MERFFIHNINVVGAMIDMTCGFFLIILFTTTLMYDNLFFLFIMALALYFFTVHNVTLPEMCLLANHSSYRGVSKTRNTE